MTIAEADKLVPGLYRLFWHSGGSSLASIGILHNGTRWFAPINWTAQMPEGIACDKWEHVNHVQLLYDAKQMPLPG